MTKKLIHSIERYIVNRLKEQSTWVGMMWCLTAFGLTHLSPDQTQAITVLGMSLFGAKGFLPDKPNGDDA